MAVVQYIRLPQCQPTSRREVTRVLAEVSENGALRARVMHRRPTYELQLSHNGLSKEQFDQWDAWWANNYNNEIAVKWAADGNTYRGMFMSSPDVEAVPYQSFNVSVTLLVKHASAIPVVAAPGSPGTLEPVAAEDLAALVALGGLGNVTAWSTGQYVVLLDDTEAYWTGTTWAAGRAP